MEKRLIGSLAILVVVAGLGVVATKSHHESEIESLAQDGPQAAPISKQPKQDVYSLVDRYKGYTTLAELKNDADLIVVADFVEKQAFQALSGGEIMSENKFLVQRVLKGQQDLEQTQIPVFETGGTYQDKDHPGLTDFFGTGRYLLCLEKLANPVEREYPVYLVEGIFSGKFLLDHGTVIGFGSDLVREEAEALSGKNLILKME